MSNDGEKKIRVFFASTQAETGASFASAASAAPGFNLRHYTGPLEDIWREAIAHSSDVAVLCFPDFSERHEKCVKRILMGCFSKVFLFIKGKVSDDIAAQVERVTVFSVGKLQTQYDDIISRIHTAAGVKRGTDATVNDAAKAAGSSILAEAALASKIIAIGASTGGTEALATLFRGLHGRLPGIVVVQHMPPGFTEMFAARLNKELSYEVLETKHNLKIMPGTIHIAPGDRHLMIKKTGGSYYTVIGDTSRVNGHCPSVDVLFDSVASAAGGSATGVILTGMGADGAKGLLNMRQNGAFTVGQDEKSCVVYGMPRKAYELGAVEKQAGLRDIAPILMKHYGV